MTQMQQDSVLLKPKLKTQELIEHLKGNGVMFALMSEADAFTYLEQNNNYFKLTAYRKNFKKEPLAGFEKDQYINLDFGHLRALAVIDMRLRYILMHMCADVEHALKVRLMRAITQNQREDGYDIVNDFEKSLDPNVLSSLKCEIERVDNAPYCCDILNKYNGKFPVWAYIEILPFGRLLDLYKFYFSKYLDKNEIDFYYVLTDVRQLRNAVAHNNCIINDLRPIEYIKPNGKPLRPKHCVMDELQKIGTTKSSRGKRMINPRMCQVVSLLYAHKELVLSIRTKKHRYEELHNLVDVEMVQQRDIFKHNDLLCSSYDFFKKVVDGWCRA